MSEPGQLWDRLPQETAKAYRAFTAYRDAGPQRSLRSTARALGRSRSLLDHWSADHNWVSRAEAYDAMLRATAQAAYEQGVRDEAARWAERQNEQRDEEWGMARALMSKAGAMLRFPLATARQEEDEEGRVVTIVNPAKWSMRDAAAMATAAASLARLAADMAVPGGASVPQQAVEKVISDADYIAEVLARLDESGTFAREPAGEDEQVRAASAAPASNGSTPGTSD